MVLETDSRKGFCVARKRYTIEQIITKLREAEVELSKGLKTPEVCRKLGVSENTYYRWRKEYGGLRTDQARTLPLASKKAAADLPTSATCEIGSNSVPNKCQK